MNNFQTSWLISFLVKESKPLHNCTNRITYSIPGYVTFEQKEGKTSFLLKDVVTITVYNKE